MAQTVQLAVDPSLSHLLFAHVQFGDLAIDSLGQRMLSRNTDAFPVAPRVVAGACRSEGVLRITRERKRI